MATLISPGISVTITDEAPYNTAGQGTIPLILIATATNKPSPTGNGIAPQTVPTQAGKLYLATSQRDVIQSFGNPTFYSSQGTPLHGYELNEYGLWAAYSYLGIANQCYVLRADLDMAQLAPSASAPSGPPVAGTYWFNLTTTKWGVLRANGNSSPASAWSAVTVQVAMSGDVDNSDVPLSSFGADGEIAVVPLTASNYLYERVGGTWYKIGTSQWAAAHPTTVTGTVTSATLTSGNAISINGTTVTFSQSTPHISDVVTDINNANIANIAASTASNGALVITNSAGGSITLANVTGTPLATLGLTAGTFNGVAVTWNNGAAYPTGVVAGSLWVKGNPANNGASWAVEYYNGALAQWQMLTAPFYQFNSTLQDGNASKDAAAIAAMPNPAAGNVYIGYDPSTGDQQIRRWSGVRWEVLTYEADFAAPSTTATDGTYWYSANLKADILYGNGSNWLGYRHQFPETDQNGPQIAGSAPTTQSTGAALVDNDIWIDGSDLENYPKIYRYTVATQTWTLVDNTDHTTPNGIVFADARVNSGPTFTGIANGGDYTYNSTASSDMALSDFLDPDAPDPREYPAGTLLYNTRFGTYNVKKWNGEYFYPGGFDPNTDFTLNTYSVGNTDYVFPATTAGRWITASGNKVDGSPYMGRKAQRAIVVQALSAVVTANQDIRSEIVFFNLMAAPGYPELIPDIISLNTDMKNVAFQVADTPARLTPTGSAIQGWANNAADAAITGEDGLVNSDPYTAVYYPWGLSTNLDGSQVMVPPSAIALVTMAYNDQVAYPWYPPAGFHRGLVTNATSVGYLNATTGEYTATILNNGQRDVLYVNKINPIAYIPNRGLVVYGQKTLSPIADASDRVNVARLENYIYYQLDNILKPFLFELNVTATRASAQAVVERFFNSLVSLNGIYDYSVVCDLSNNTPDRIDANELWIDCAVQPVKAIEFIYVPVRIVNTQATTQISSASTL